MSFLSDVLGGIGGTVIAGEAQQAADAATQAFYVIAGELFVIAILLVAILFRVWN